MFRTPSDLSQINVKYHTHFISNDYKYGGHVFDFSAPSATVEIQKIDKIVINLPTQKYKVIKNAKTGTIDDFTYVVDQ